MEVFWVDFVSLWDLGFGETTRKYRHPTKSVALSNTRLFVSDPKGLCLLPGSVKLWQDDLSGQLESWGTLRSSPALVTDVSAQGHVVS